MVIDAKDIACRRKDPPVCTGRPRRASGGALVRIGVDPAHVRELLGHLTHSPHEVVALNTRRARSALTLGMRLRLRGADATYAALAADERLPLCTLDHEMASRAGKAVRVMAP
jgi:predicted nucleic acid-binding protein